MHLKKILFITHDDLAGGSAKAFFEQIQYVQKQFDPIVVTLTKNKLYLSLKKMGIEVYATRYGFTSIWNTIRLFLPIKWLLYGSWLNYFAFIKIRKKIPFSSISLIVSNSSVINFGAYIHRKTGIPHIHFLREYGDDLVPLISNIGRIISNNADLCISVSQAVANRWIEKGSNESKIKVVYDGINPPQPPHQLFHNNEKIKICICGRISKFKGQIFAIKSLLLLPDSIRKKIVLDIYGNGPTALYLKLFVKKHHLKENVFFKGFSSNLDYELYNYNIGLNLTEKEGFGRTTVEYMMHRLYVIGCDSGATPELLCNGKYGALVEYGNPAQIAQEIVKYEEKRSEKLAIAAQAQSFAKENYTISKNVEQLKEIYAKFTSQIF